MLGPPPPPSKQSLKKEGPCKRIQSGTKQKTLAVKIEHCKDGFSQPCMLTCALICFLLGRRVCKINGQSDISIRYQTVAGHPCCTPSEQCEHEEGICDSDEDCKDADTFLDSGVCIERGCPKGLTGKCCGVEMSKNGWSLAIMSHTYRQPQSQFLWFDATAPIG